MELIVRLSNDTGKRKKVRQAQESEEEKVILSGKCLFPKEKSDIVTPLRF